MKNENEMNENIIKKLLSKKQEAQYDWNQM